MVINLKLSERKGFPLFENSGKNKQLWSRKLGRKLREKAEEILEGMSAGSLLEIDVSEIEIFDYSFASELFAKLVLHLPIDYLGICLAVKGLNSSTEENLDTALKMTGVMMLVNEEDGCWHLLGKFSGADQTTLDALSRTEGSVSVQDLAKQLDIQVTTCSERLSRLAQLGTVHRLSAGSGRVQYRYSSIV